MLAKIVRVSAYVCFLTVLIASTGEIYCRVKDLAPQNRDRALEPYLENGSFLEGNSAEPVDRGLPAFYGYEKHGLNYYYTFKTPVHSIVERGQFLDQIAPRNNGKRIYVLGGSLAQGSGSTPGHEWWRTLQKKVRTGRQDSSIQVIPQGMGSWISTQERIALNLFVLPRNPSAVVVLDGANDVALGDVLTRPGDPFNQGVLYSRYYSPAFQVVRAISNWSALARYFLLRDIQQTTAALRHEIESDPSRRNNFIASQADVYSDNLRQMALECNLHKVPCFFFLQPLQPITGFRMGLAPIGAHQDEYIQVQLLATKQLLGMTGFSHFTDLTSLMDGHLEDYVDEMHLRNPGQERLGEQIAKTILESDWDPRTGSRRN